MTALKPSPPLRGRGQGEGGDAPRSEGSRLIVDGGASPPSPRPPPRKGEGEARPPGAIVTSERGERAAKRLRRTPTYAEARLWKHLRTLKADGLHFRRQAPIGPYVVDFACHGARLVLELDGGVHDLPQVAAHDAERDRFLHSRGYRVLRVRNEVALDRPEDLRNLLTQA